MKEGYQKIFEDAFKENSSVEDIFMLIYITKYVNIDSWSEINDIIEETFGERANWQECKNRMTKTWDIIN